MFELNGDHFTLEDLRKSANEQGYGDNFGEFLQIYKDAGMIEIPSPIDTNEYIQTPGFEQVVEQKSKDDIAKEIKQKEILSEIYQKSYAIGQGIPEWMAPYHGPVMGFVTNLLGSIASVPEKAYETSLGMTKEEMLEDGKNTFSRVMDEMTEYYDKVGIKKYDELTGQETDFYGLVEDERWGDAADLLSFQIITEAPALAVTAAFPILGSFVLGVSEVGRSFEESLENRPDETLENIWLNSLAKGGAEWGTEFAGGILARKVLMLGAAGKATKKTVTELSANYGLSMLKRAGLGFIYEGSTEGATDFFQQGADQLIFGDPKTTHDYIRGFINKAVVGGLLGGGVSGVSRAAQGKDREKIYQFVAPKQWQDKQMRIAKQIHDNTKDLKIAKKDNDTEKIKFFENNISELVAKANKNKKDLYDKFNSMSRSELIKYAENLDIAQGALDIIGNKKYSEQAQALAENKARDAYQKNFDMIGEGAFDVGVEQSIGEALKAAEIISEKLKKVKGINRDDLDIITLRNQKDIDKLPEEIKRGVERSDGTFLTDKDNKATIYINLPKAASASATNVLGHELLHYMISRKFKTDNKSMQPLIGELKNYLQKNHTKVYSQVQRRIDEFYTNKDGSIKEDALEEYLNVFSDLIATKKIDLKQAGIKGFAGSITDVMAGFGFGEIKLDTAQDIISFLSTYNKNINRKGLLGKLMGVKMLDVDLVSKKLVERPTKTPVKGTKKKSITAEQKLQIEDNVKTIGETYSVKGGKNLWDQFGADEAIKEIKDNKFLDDLIAAKYKADIVPGDFVTKVYSELTSHIKNFNPETNDNLFGWINSQIGNKAGNVYNREYKQLEQEKTAKDIDEKTAEGTPVVQVAAEKDVRLKQFEEEDILATQIAEKRGEKIIDKTTPEEDQGRILQDLSDVELNNMSDIDDAVMDKVESLIDKNPKDLEQQIEKLIEKEFTKLIRKGMGKISKIKGKTVVSEEYKKWHDSSYNDIVNSLSDDVIKNNYKNLFNLTKVAREKDKKVNPITGKVTYPGKGIFKIETNKDKWTEYFTQGGYTTLLERQRALAKLIAQAKTKRATNNYIEQNSTDINKVIEAKLRKFEQSLDNQKNQIGSFDSIKYSISVSKQFIQDILIDVDTLYDTGKFPSKGHALEQAINNYLRRQNIPGLKTLVEIATEEDGMADLLLAIEMGGVKIGEFGVEIKLGTTNVRLTSNRITSYNVATGEVKLTEKDPYTGIFNREKILKSVRKEIKAYYDDINNTISRYNKGETIVVGEKKYTKGKNKTIPLIKTSKDLIPKFAHKTALQKGLGVNVQKNSEIETDLGKLVEQTYLQKKYPSNYIEFLGNFFALGQDKFFRGDVPVLAGIANVQIQMGSSGTVKTVEGESYGVDMVRVAPRIMPSPKKITSVAKGSIVDGDYMNGLMKKHYPSIDVVNENVKNNKTLSTATKNSRSSNNPTKGITVLDFDDTLATTKSLVKYTTPEGKTGTLNAEEYASTYENLLDQGYTFDFSDFNKVVKGKLAPLFNKAIKLQSKFGPDNMFVLTARPAAAQKAIFDFLKANGLNIPLKNITGLGNSTAEAKALWIADKVGEGYNDFYFADDALQNVQAVKNMLDQFDVKSKVQQAKVKFSKSLDGDFNSILEDVTKIDANKRFSAAKARKRGEGRGRFRMFIPPSHEDFVGLLYNFIGKGDKGNQHRDFFERALIKPLNRAYLELNAAKQAISNDYRNLIKAMPDTRKKLTKKTPDGDFTYGDAVRVYLWDKFGFEVPGLSKADQKELSDLIKNDVELQSFADAIGLISKQEEGYVKPTEEWEAGDVRTDLADATSGIGRKQFFTEFIENADVIFSQENLNKIEAAYGKNFREALEDILYRTKNGTNRRYGSNRLVNRFTDWINGAVGSTMFLNARSGILQQLSMVNFINYGDNNIFKAAAAFANQLQYWKDYAMIFNSDFLKQRRSGIAFDVNGAELAQAVSKSKEPARAAIRYLLQKGFILTQIGDSNAIAMGGATFYRNRVNTYLKQGLTKKEAETKAFTDFQEIAEMTQQSARPDMISQQQSSPLGKFILAFQNTPSQYLRMIKKAGLDLVNRRKSKPYKTQWQSDMSNISRILYYGTVQNIIFYGLQSAMFAMLFSDDDEDKEFFDKKRDRLINGSIDSLLRGMGVGGAIISTLKNTAFKIAEERGKTWGGSTDILMNELLQLSPPLGIKARKLSSAEKTLKYNKKVIKEMETFDIDNPIWDATGNVIEGVTNVPTARLHRKITNTREALNAENEWWQRLALGLGWSKWDVGVKNEEIEAVKEEIKSRNKIKKKKKKKKQKPLTKFYFK